MIVCGLYANCGGQMRLARARRTYEQEILFLFYESHVFESHDLSFVQCRLESEVEILQCLPEREVGRADADLQLPLF